MAVNGSKAFNSLAVMRDQKLVFFTTRTHAFDESLAPSDALAKIRELYEAFDESHPPQD